jgi:hypothetical protein
MKSLKKGGIASFNTKNIEQFHTLGKNSSILSLPTKLQSSPTSPSNYYISVSFPKPSRILIKPQNFEANNKFTYLSHSLYNGDKKDKNGVPISPHNPPEYITYDMLISEIGIYLNDEMNDDEELKKQFKMASEIEKEELKNRLWVSWYKIINGYDSYENTTYKKVRQSRQSQRTSKAKRFTMLSPPTRRKSVGGVGSPSSPRPEDVAFFNFLTKQMEFYLNGADKITKDRYGYTNHDYEMAYFDFANENAKIAVSDAYDARMRLSKNINDDKIKVHDIVCKFKPDRFPYPDPTGFNTLFQPSDKLYMYGMQLPHQFNRELLLNSMLYLLHMKVYNVADLQGCSDAINRQNRRMDKGIGCNPYDRDCEFLMWRAAKKLTLEQPEYKCNDMKPDQYISQKEIDNLVLTSQELGYLNNGEYYDIKIEDMTAGYMKSWEYISKINDTSKKENSIVVHCLAGAGRTGSVMLYLLLRDSRQYLSSSQKLGYEKEIKERLAQAHFGYTNIKDVITFMKVYFINYSSNAENVKNELFKVGSKIMDSKTTDLLLQKGVDRRIIRMILAQGLDGQTRAILVNNGVDEKIIKMIEKQQTKSLAISSLLRQRLNRIFFFLAKEFDVKEFYTYGRPTKQVVNLPNDEFSNPVKRIINDWQNYDKYSILNWIN